MTDKPQAQEPSKVTIAPENTPLSKERSLTLVALFHARRAVPVDWDEIARLQDKLAVINEQLSRR